MKKILLITIAFCLSASAFSQKWLDDAVYGSRKQGISAKRVLMYPTGCGAPSSLNSKDSSEMMAAIYFDTCNHKKWWYDPSTKLWDSTGASFGGGSDGWGSQVVEKGVGLLGTGITGDPLKSDTVFNATRRFVDKLKDSNKVAVDARMQGDVLAAVSDFSSFNKTEAKTLFVKDTLQGGHFVLYSGTDTADGGMIFTDGLSRKWLRQTEGDRVNINWYGVYPYNNYTIDVAPYIKMAIDYIHNHKQKYRKLYFPSGYNSSGQAWYRLMSTVNLEDIEIIGDGTAKNPTSMFQVSEGITAFYAPYLDQTGGINRITVKNIAVRHYDPSGATDSNHHSFDIRCFFDFDNVYVWQNLNGNGFNVVACAGAADSSLGNADQSRMNFGQAELCINNLFVSGCDANVINFTNCSFVNAKRWGVYDDGMLGNYYENCHWSGNGQQINTGCTYSGKYYAAIDGLYNVGKRPDLFPSYWYEVPPMGGYTAWDTTRKYWSGGIMMVKNVNAWTTVKAPYTESFQAPGILNGRSKVEGGDQGTLFYWGITERLLNGTLILTTIRPEGNTQYRAGVQADRLSINQAPDGNYQLSVTGETYQVMQAISPTNLTNFNMQNNSGLGNGGFSYYNNEMLGIAGGNYITKTTPTQFGVWTDNATNLGEPSAKWKDVYAATYHGDGSALTGVAPATSGTSILKGNGSGGFSNAAAETDYTSPSGTGTLTNKTISGSSNTLSNIAQSSVTNLTSDLAAMKRRYGAAQAVGTDANITATAGTTYDLPTATLSANRSIDVSGLNTDGDYIEVLNNEAGFTWSFSGATVYLVDRTTTVTNLLTAAFYQIRRINGKLIIIN